MVAPRQATREQLARVHDADYLRRISETSGRAVALDQDTYTSPESHEVALLAAGAAIDAVERVMGGSHQAALALGHIDVIAEADLKLWDWAALLPVIKGAGGLLTDWQGRELRLSFARSASYRVLAVGDPGLLGPVTEVLTN